MLKGATRNRNPLRVSSLTHNPKRLSPDPLNGVGSTQVSLDGLIWSQNPGRQALHQHGHGCWKQMPGSAFNKRTNTPPLQFWSLGLLHAMQPEPMVDSSNIDQAMRSVTGWTYREPESQVASSSQPYAVNPPCRTIPRIHVWPWRRFAVWTYMEPGNGSPKPSSLRLRCGKSSPTAAGQCGIPRIAGGHGTN